MQIRLMFSFVCIAFDFIYLHVLLLFIHITHLFHRFDSLDLDCKKGVCKMRKWKADADGGWRMAMAEGGRRKIINKLIKINKQMYKINI